MPRLRKLDPASLAFQLQVQGPATAKTLAATAQVDRSRVSRAIGQLSGSVIRLGVTRGARYALRRSVRGAGDAFPIRRIDAVGQAHDWAELTALHGGWRITWADPKRSPVWSRHVLTTGGLVEGFPFFLGDVRPQGYLGRSVGHRLPTSLGLSVDPRNWSDDDTLIYLQAEGDDLPGDLIVGDEPLRRVQSKRIDGAFVAIAEADRGERYPERAAGSLLLGVGASSVEGEQPKFIATLGGGPGADANPVIVKFTDALTTPTGRRWADLLAAEAHALAILHEQGEAHAAPRLLDAGGRRFMEFTRYDRVGSHGRRGVVSLRALHQAFASANTNDWTVSASQLAEEEWITPECLRSIRLRHSFGRLIGNTDMHFGNLAFWLGDDVPFELAPAYDVLPMLWAPTAGEATPRPEFTPLLPLPAEREIWRTAASWAVEFWARVAADARVSAEFSSIAGTAEAAVTRRLAAL